VAKRINFTGIKEAFSKGRSERKLITSATADA